jgi:ABC-2 type transport system ATP-binding protein/nitrous oxidase accessory protein
MLAVRSLSKSFGDLRALDEVSFDVHGGQVVALIGANGAGKTTLLKCLLGLLKFDGVASLDGVDLGRKGKQARSRIGYLPQTPAFHTDLTVQETLAFYSDLRRVPMEQAHTLIATVGLADRGTTRVGELSGGMRQRLGLAVALLGDPALLLLDEPVSGLDVSSRLELRRLVREQAAGGRTVMLSTHWLEDVPYIADHLLMLDRGKLVHEGTAASIATSNISASRVYLRLNGHGPEALPLIRRFTGREVDQSGDWMIARCPAVEKARLIETLIEAGITILDFRVEEAPVDEAVRQMQEIGANACMRRG